MLWAKCKALLCATWGILGCGDTAVIILNLYIRSRWAVTFSSPLYYGGHKPIYPLNRRFCWPQCTCERFEENKNLLLLQETEPRFFYCSTSDTPMTIALSVLLFVLLFKTLIFVSVNFIYETLGFVRILWLEARYYSLIPLSKFYITFHLLGHATDRKACKCLLTENIWSFLTSDSWL